MAILTMTTIQEIRDALKEYDGEEAIARMALFKKTPDYIRTLLERVDQLEAAKPEHWLPKSITVADIAAQCQKVEQERDALRAEFLKLFDGVCSIRDLLEVRQLQDGEPAGYEEQSFLKLWEVAEAARPTAGSIRSSGVDPLLNKPGAQA